MLVTVPSCSIELVGSQMMCTKRDYTSECPGSSILSYMIFVRDLTRILIKC
ncbi:unnamed protein product [Strongylus vulgaris]|uniref:Uncharacterized protein n=1 Tax=Strongylus vulgaris TaxID=40348 RepID=A0A3P7IZG7_STRVU|nr:unnamed protein product [Strongylus vulgaris]